MKFEERYKKLNAEQKKAVDTIEGPVLVVAGPGTGKTEILTLRIARILQDTQTAPENILALTFTEAGAANMRKRLASLIGSPAYRVVIQTFHSFCNSVIQTYPEFFPNIIGSGTITEVESVALIEELILTLPLSVLRPWGEQFHYVRDIVSKISELKREGLSATDFAKLVIDEEKKFGAREDLIHEKGAHKGKMKSEFKKLERKIQKNKELSDIYTAYQEAVHTKRLYDWSDMIMEVLRALREVPDLKLQLQENHQYILVDEHQDTNNAQNAILEILCDFHQSPNIFIVGDTKQAIFRFQGASIGNFLHFKTLYKNAITIELSQNYRSGQTILDGAHSLMSSSTPLVAGGPVDTAHILYAQFARSEYELAYVSQEIKKHIDAGTPGHEIAVLYRSNKDAFGISHALSQDGIPHTIESDEDLFGDVYVKKILAIFDCLHNYGDDACLSLVLHMEEWGVEPIKAYRLIKEASATRTPLYDVLKKSEDPKVTLLYEQMEKWVKESRQEHLLQFLEKVLRESGLLQSLIASKDASAFLGIERLFEEAKRMSANRPGVSFADFMQYIETIKEHKLFIKRPKQQRTGLVRFMTVHKSKGLEFEHVYIIHATEHAFGPKSDRDHLPLLDAVYRLSDTEEDEEVLSTEDERRLFYVALTRAKKSVSISHAQTDLSGRDLLPSPFILELRPDRVTTLDVSSFEETLKNNPAHAYREVQKNTATVLDADFVKELFYAHPLSVTALNNYLSCPWKYFYRNLLRIPSTPARHQIYGTAMHHAVEEMFKAFKERGMDKKFLLDSYTRHLTAVGILREHEYEEALVRGKEALSGWFDQIEEPSVPIVTEYSIPHVSTASGIELAGKLDKVEFVNDGHVWVTDYKTGKPKSRNVIEGKTKEGNADIKRQLVFYSLILGLHNQTEMDKGIIEFLEPNDSGKYVKEEFVVTTDEVSELEQTIEKVAEEITTLAFWDKSCDDKECEYCGYRKLITR
ncbi:MAG: ATP-dependent DNA helicase [Candidatus Zambryskibacteria bacterium]|nr:ATP-dependent DNA helicase [Candidatus Zambryskibacteria bacterium]